MEQDVNINMLYKHMQDFLDGQLSEDQFQVMDRRLREDPEFLKMYVEYVTISGALHRYSQNSQIPCGEEMEGPCNELIWRLLVDHEHTADPAELPADEKKASIPVPVTRQETVRLKHRVSRFTVVTVALSMAAMLFMVVYVRLVPVGYGQEAATIVDVFSREAARDTVEFTAGTRLKRGQTVSVKQGHLVQIEFDYGATVTIEGPGDFEINSGEQMFLHHGKLFADIPGRAVGFIVSTPSCRIVDLGTRFGLHVEGNGSTQLHMVSGAASLLAGQGTQMISSHVIKTGQARYVDAASSQVQEVPLQPGQFVQQFCSEREFVWNGQPFNLASVVGGENGFRPGNREIGIHPLTGQYITRRNMTTEEQFVLQAISSVPDQPLIDSVFIPNSQQGPVRIAQDGLIFEGFPKLPRGLWVGLSSDFYYVDADLKGSDRIGLGKSAKQTIYMHANLGVTFDLDKIRQVLPGLEIRGFRALRGFREDQGDLTNKADFWVLVDGQCVWKDLGVHYSLQLEPVWIPLDKENRYLTLATTESDDGRGNDWTIFVDPVLELVYDSK